MTAPRIAGVFALLLIPLLLAEEKKEEDFTPLFNGKNLAGWVPVNAAPGTFSVKDGMLVTTGVPTGLIRTAKRYENFVLECEWMHVKEKGNSGIFVWADPLPAVGSPFTRAIEVQVLDGHETKDYTSHGDVFAIWGAKFVPDREHPSKWMRCLPSEKRAHPAGKWNHYRIECNDGAIKLAVNGKVVSGGTKSTPRFGYICLEAEGSECRYKNLRIKELPSRKPKPEETCPEAQGHTTLFTGVDLKGWKMVDEDKGKWKAEGGANVLRFTGKETGALFTEKSYGDFELIIDRKAAKGTAPAVAWGGKGSFAYYMRPAEDSEAGKWARFVFRFEKRKVTVIHNGKVVRDGEPIGAALATEPGPISLLAAGPCDFANLFIRELK